MADKRWIIHIPEDGTIYAGRHDEAFMWTVDPARAQTFPTYHRATLARLAIDRSYEGVGFYSTAVREAEEL